MRQVVIKEGDRITITALYLQIPGWRDSQPCIILSPVIKYTETACASYAVEDFLISAICDGYCEDDDIEMVYDRLKEGDHVIASEISRLGRELFMIFKILEGFTQRGILLDTVKDNYHLDNSITSKVLAFAFGMAANIERDMISKRTIEGLAARRKAGVVFGRPIGAKSKTLKLDKFDAKIKDLLTKGLTYSAIAKILNVHRITVANICKKNGWDKQYLPKERQEAIRNIAGRNQTSIRVKNAKKIETPLQDILDLYREHKSLQKIAELLNVTTAALKTYMTKNKMWDDLIELDKQLRLEFPSITKQAEIYGMDRLSLRKRNKKTSRKSSIFFNISDIFFTFVL
jgi:DNA invertase Pin-like site-specific DNA recombinase